MVFLIISINLFEFCEAPPIKNPSIPVIIFNLSTLLLFTDPPYNIFIDLLPNLLFIYAIDFINSSDFGIRPDPIDHTGS